MITGHMNVLIVCTIKCSTSRDQHKLLPVKKQSPFKRSNVITFSNNDNAIKPVIEFSICISYCFVLVHRGEWHRGAICPNTGITFTAIRKYFTTIIHWDSGHPFDYASIVHDEQRHQIHAGVQFTTKFKIERCVPPLIDCLYSL